MRLILLDNNLDIIASQDEKYEMAISASNGTIRFDQFKLWLSERTKRQ